MNDPVLAGKEPVDDAGQGRRVGAQVQRIVRRDIDDHETSRARSCNSGGDGAEREKTGNDGSHHGASVPSAFLSLGGGAIKD
jgi:hypothetical protein